MSKKLFLIDAHSHAYKAFYGMPRMTSPDRRPTNAVYGFTGMLLKILKEQKPDYIAVVFDYPAKTFRHTLYTAYKEGRMTMPEELRPQIPLIKDVVTALKIPILSVEGCEADDVIGTLARKGSDMGIDVYIATSDKDALQLLDEHVRVYDTKDGREYGPKNLEEDKHIRPEQVIDMMALSGDTSDNVPGIKGIGPKTALTLIQEYGTLENVLDHAAEIKQKALQKKLMEGREAAILSKQLVTIDCDRALEINIDECAVREADEARLQEIFRDLGFKKFLTEMAAESPTIETPAAPVEPVAAGRGTVRYTTVDTPDALAKLSAELSKQKLISFDTETTSTSPMKARLVGLSFAWKESEAYYVPVMGPLGSKLLPLDLVIKTLRPVLESTEVEKVGQNIKYDYILMRRAGVRMRGIVFDTMVAAYLTDPERRRYNLDDLSAGFLGIRKIPISDLIGSGRKQTTMDLVEVAMVSEYSCEDADVTLRLRRVLSEELEKRGLAKLAEKFEFPLIEVLGEMEYVGMKIDAEALGDFSKQLDERISALCSEIYAETGGEFNLDSPKQLASVLFEKMQMPMGRKTKTGFSTDADVLEELSINFPLAAKISQYRGLKKLKSTYADALPKIMNRETGRVHTSFNQTMTATGRLSSSEPNLQNIPIRTEDGREIRRAFIPSSANKVLLSGDYSQIELRILAHMSADTALRAAFLEDLDIHAFVAAEVNGVGIDDVDPEMRRKAKAVNFGIIYGLTPFGLSKDIGVPVGEAKHFIDSYFARYSCVQTFIQETVETARKQGFVQTMFGRRRYLPMINSRNEVEKKFAERMAVNAVIQGTAADMAKLAMINIQRRIEKEKLSSVMLLQIHDELLFEIDKDKAEAERAIIEAEMSGVAELSVPVKVNIGVGPNWLET